MKLDSPAACRFFTVEDALRFAVAAYYGASRDIEPPPGEPWADENGAWAGPASFGDAVVTRFMAAIVGAAIDARIPCDHGCATPSFSWDDSDFPGARFSGPELNGLPPSNNAPDNASQKGVRGG